MPPRTPMQKSQDFHSSFGGLWIDRIDFPKILQEKLDHEELTQEEAAGLQTFEKNGFIILRNAVDVEIIDQINAYIDSLWQIGKKEVLLDIFGKYLALETHLRSEPFKILDL